MMLIVVWFMKMSDIMSSDIFTFKGREIPVVFDQGHDFHMLTPKYYSIITKIEDKGIPPMHFVDAIDWFLNQDRRIPILEKKSINRIIVSPDNKILCLEMRLSIVTYRLLYYIAEQTGWYFYITGSRLPSSLVTTITNSITPRFSVNDLQRMWSVTNEDKIAVTPISLHKNAICFLLNVGKMNLLLDAGYNKALKRKSIIDSINKSLDNIDGIFLSHAHFDHYGGLIDIIKQHTDTKILTSSTTLDFFVYRNSKKKWIGMKEPKLELEIPDDVKKVIENSIVIKEGSRIDFPGGVFDFYYAGHMPGALMLYIRTSNFKFLYTGDFSFQDYSPIPGVESSVPILPADVDCAIVDAASGNQSYPSKKKVLQELHKKVRSRVERGYQVLIGADEASTAIVIYLSLFKYFRKLQYNKGSTIRPRIILGRNTLEYSKIVQQRVEDLHPNIRFTIENELSPFSSALTKYYTDARDIFSWINTKGVVFIFGPSDLNSRLMQDLLRSVGSSNNNLVYLSGALRSKEAIELASGTNTVQLGGKEFTNEAEVFNVTYPDIALNLHSDSKQIIDLVNTIHPKKVCLFHTSDRAMIPIRAKLSKLEFVDSTIALKEGMGPLDLCSI